MSPSFSTTRSTSSSLSSTPASSPPASKTNAFFASSFAATPPPPRPPLSLKKVSSGSSTESNDDTESVKRNDRDRETATTPSLFSQAKTSRFNVSRIFPSRYTRARRDSTEQIDLANAFSSNSLRKKPDFLFIDIDAHSSEPDQIHSPREHHLNDLLHPLPTPVLAHERTRSDSSMSPLSSVSSSSSHVEIRLPTPPPPPLLTASSMTFSHSEFTPRPSDLEPPPGISQNETQPLHEESIPPNPELREGDVIADSRTAEAVVLSPSLRLIRPLGQGAFSAVWLAQDLSTVPLTLASKKSVRDFKRQASIQGKGHLSRSSSVKATPSGGVSRNSSLKRLRARLRGTRPSVDASLLDGGGAPRRETTWIDEAGRLLPSSSSMQVHGSPNQPAEVGLGASLSRNNSASKRSSPTRVVAVKLTPRRPKPYSSQAEERTRVGFIREVEVLRHISHPNITPLLSFFSTPTHHVLVLPHLKGGDLLSLVNDDGAWGRLSEGVLRRMWCEICRAVGWMHSVGLVHRDIKLENVLLTWEGLSVCESAQDSGSIPRTPIEISDLPTPLVKLTDFGLSRFIDIGNGEPGQGELLSTRCGSEAYAAPELVMGGGPRGVYDARETDAWACGVMLYALVARKLPFGEGVGVDGGHGNTSHIGGERAVQAGGRRRAVERRHWLMRIARGEYEWPEAPHSLDGDSGTELVGVRLASSEGVRRIAGKLMVRDPKKRARIGDLWDDPWMRADIIGEGVWEDLQGQRNPSDEVDSGAFSDEAEEVKPDTKEDPIDLLGEQEPESPGAGDWEPLEEGDELDDEEEGEDEGWLLDEQSIASIARQEVV
ncbi:kinase-like protein [Coprinopsis marcescibilis]|uniref:Kinase-like protein n=1 Tax=Coprinopsis marcescibilis TaxID=230819 RepID=A0A5C3KYR3_COPMA|nr:kinase-like protein [Coprinopsis marcescibilis]